MKRFEMFIWILSGVGGFWTVDAHPTYSQPTNPEVAFHGMLVINSDIPTQSGLEPDIYIHHLPMFVIPHRFQGLWKVTFGEQADRSFHEHRNRTRNEPTIYTLVPQTTFALRELMESRDSFRADLFHGHFERGGEVLIPNTPSDWCKISIGMNLDQLMPHRNQPATSSLVKDHKLFSRISLPCHPPMTKL